MAGWNFFFYEALLIPFEITALNTVLKYWVITSRNLSQLNLANIFPSVMTSQLLLSVLLASYYTRTWRSISFQNVHIRRLGLESSPCPPWYWCPRISGKRQREKCREIYRTWIPTKEMLSLSLDRKDCEWTNPLCIQSMAYNHGSGFIKADPWNSILNFLAVKAYGEAEFWLSGGKVILIVILFSFTFVTMVGSNFLVQIRKTQF